MNIISHIQEMLAKSTISAYVALGIAAVCAVLTLVGMLQGLRRGVVRQTLRVMTIGLSAIIAYFIARGVMGGVMGLLDGKTMEEVLASLGLLGELQAAAEESIVNFICTINPGAVQHILALPLAIIVSPIVFLTAFVFVSGILLIPYAILCGVFGITKRNNNALTRISGLVMGAAQGLIVSAIVLLPISSVIGVVNATVDGIREPEQTVMVSDSNKSTKTEYTELEKTVLDAYDAYLSDVAESPILSLLDNCGGKLINKKLSSVKIDGVTRDMRDTIPSLFGIANEAMKLSELDVANLTEDDKDTIVALIDKLMDEPFTASIIVEGFRVAANAVDAGLIDLSTLKEPYVEIVNSAVSAFTDSTAATVKTDLGTLCEVFFTISDAGLLSGEEIDVIELLSAPEDENVIIIILDILSENERFDSVSTTIVVTISEAVTDGTLDILSGIPEDMRDIVIELIGVLSETDSIATFRNDVLTVIEVFTLIKDVEFNEDTDYIALLFDAEEGEDSILIAALKILDGSRFDKAVVSAINSFASNSEFTASLEGSMKDIVQPFLDVFADENLTLSDIIADVEAIGDVVTLLNDRGIFEEGADYIEMLFIKEEGDTEALIETVIAKLKPTDFAEPIVDAFKSLAGKDENGEYTLLAESNDILKTVLEPLLEEVERTENIAQIEEDVADIIDVVAILHAEGLFDEESQVDYIALLFAHNELPGGETQDSAMVRIIDVFINSHSRYNDELTAALTNVATEQLETDDMTPALAIVTKAVLNLLNGIDSLEEVRDDIKAIGNVMTVLDVEEDVDMLSLLKKDESGKTTINKAIEELDGTPELQNFLLEIVNGLADGVIKCYDGEPAAEGEIEVSLGELGEPTLSFVISAMEVFAEIDTVDRLEHDVDTISNIVAILEREGLISEDGNVSVDVIVLFTEQIEDSEGNPVVDELGEPVTVIDEILAEFKLNPDLNPVLLELVRSMSDNIELMNVGAPFDMLIQSIADVFETSTEETVVEDVETVAEVFTILAEAGVLEEGADAVAILAVKDENNETVVDRVVATLRGNERTKPIVTDFTKISLSLMMSNVTGAGASGGVSDSTVIEENYENVKGDIDSVVTNIVKSEYQNEEEKQQAVTDTSVAIKEALNNTLREEGDTEDVVTDEVASGMAEYVVNNYGDKTMDDLVESGLYDVVTDENGDAVTDENGDPVYELSDEGMTDVILSYYEAYLKSLGQGGTP